MVGVGREWRQRNWGRRAARGPRGGDAAGVVVGVMWGREEGGRQGEGV